MNTLKQDAANNVRSGYYVLKKKPKLKKKNQHQDPFKLSFTFSASGR